MMSGHTSAALKLRRSMLVACVCALGGCAGTEHVTTQQAYDGWQPVGIQRGFH
jgi:hypothetical protein